MDNSQRETIEWSFQLMQHFLQNSRRLSFICYATR